MVGQKCRHNPPATQIKKPVPAQLPAATVPESPPGTATPAQLPAAAVPDPPAQPVEPAMPLCQPCRHSSLQQLCQLCRKVWHN